MARCHLVLLLLLFFNVIHQIFFVANGDKMHFNCSQKLLFTPMDVKLCCKVPTVRLDKYRDECFIKISIGGIGKNIDDAHTFINPCAVECVFKRAGALENNHLNMSNMNALIRSNIPNNNPELIQVLHMGFEKCGKEILNKLHEFEANRQTIIKSMNKGYKGLRIACSPFAVLVSYCALRHAFIHCPENSWINTEVCNNARSYVKNCEPAQFGGPRQRRRYNPKMQNTTLKKKN